MAIKALYEKLMAISDGPSSIIDGPSSSCLMPMMPIYFLKKYLYLSIFFKQSINAFLQLKFTIQLRTHLGKSKSNYSATYLGIFLNDFNSYVTTRT